MSIRTAENPFIERQYKRGLTRKIVLSNEKNSTKKEGVNEKNSTLTEKLLVFSLKICIFAAANIQ